jgi:hypothetical protein
VRDGENQRRCIQPDPHDQPACAYPIRPARIPDGFAIFTVHRGLELSKPDGHGSGGRMGRNLPEQTRAQPYQWERGNVMWICNPCIPASVRQKVRSFTLRLPASSIPLRI